MVALNSILGLGEQIYGSMNSGMGDSFNINHPMRVFGVGALFPIGDDGLIVNPEYTNSHSVPRQVTGVVPSVGHFERVALRASYPVIRSRSSSLSLNISGEHNEQDSQAPTFGILLNKDSYWVIRGGFDLQSVTGLGQPFKLTGQFSQGLGGRDSADAKTSGIPLSRTGTTPYFHKLSLDGRIGQAVVDGIRLDVIAHSQFGFGKPQMTSEQISLEGTDAVTGAQPVSFNVDTGVSLRGELGRSFVLSGKDGSISAEPYVFVAGGAGHLYQASAVEKTSGAADARAGGFGAGLRITFDRAHGFSGASLGVEVGQAYSNLVGQSSGRRVSVVGSIRF